MTVIKTSVFSVVKRFPDRKDTVKRLFKRSVTFQTICEDYLQCVEALRYWKQSAEENATARTREYEGLLIDLEAEILQNLNELTTCGDPG